MRCTLYFYVEFNSDYKYLALRLEIGREKRNDVW